MHPEKSDAFASPIAKRIYAFLPARGLSDRAASYADSIPIPAG